MRVKTPCIFFIIHLFYSMFVYFILLKKVTWMLEQKYVPLHIYVSNIGRYVTFYSYLICLSKHGETIFELKLFGFNF